MGYLNGEVAVTQAGQILRETGSILLVDWPSKDVPETLARAGYTVLVKGGPQPDNYSIYEVRNGEVVARRTGKAPAAVDLVYSYRPVEELPGIVAMAQHLGAGADGSGGVAGGARGRRVGRPGVYRSPLYRR
jgi:predicted CoA-binding protein